MTRGLRRREAEARCAGAHRDRRRRLERRRARSTSWCARSRSSRRCSCSTVPAVSPSRPAGRRATSAATTRSTQRVLDAVRATGVDAVRVGIADGDLAAGLAARADRRTGGAAGRELRSSSRHGRSACSPRTWRVVPSWPTCSCASGCARSARSPSCPSPRCSPASGSPACTRTVSPAVRRSRGRARCRSRPSWWRRWSSTRPRSGSTRPRSRRRRSATGCSPGSPSSASRAHGCWWRRRPSTASGWRGAGATTARSRRRPWSPGCAGSSRDG